MTRLELDIGDVVLHGLPPDDGAKDPAAFGALVEERLGALARGEDPDHGRPTLDGGQSLVDQVARRVWDEVRRSADGVWDERS